jgi:hypothetical protein
MTERNDADLGDRFHALRREDAATAPRFDATLAAARARAAAPARRPTGWLAVAALVVAGIALALLFMRPDRHPRTIDLASVHWNGPTDFLLVLPGDQLLRTVPDLGRMGFSTRPGAGFTTSDSHRRTP